MLHSVLFAVFQIDKQNRLSGTIHNADISEITGRFTNTISLQLGLYKSKTKVFFE